MTDGIPPLKALSIKNITNMNTKMKRIEIIKNIIKVGLTNTAGCVTHSYGRQIKSCVIFLILLCHKNI